MPRHFPDWLEAFVEYGSVGEAPLDTLFWTGVSSIAGALRRHVYVDQLNYRYYANHYIILVAPPGIISKSTTAGIGINLLNKVPGIKFGPGAATWQALIARLEEATEGYQDADGEFWTQSALTILSSELGMLLDPKDRGMLDSLTHLWDAETGHFEKATKTVESNKITNPFLNIIGCTTPSWLSNHMPEYVLGGGFASRCTFVFADEKRQRVAYPARHMPPARYAITRQHLIDDLTEIASIIGEVKLTEEAYDWGTKWYEEYLDKPPSAWVGEHSQGYWARKQTHLHKLALVLAASSDSRWITEVHLARAADWIGRMELNLGRVFEMIGRSSDAVIANQVLKTVQSLNGKTSPTIVKAMLMKRYGGQEVQRGIDSCIAAGQLRSVTMAGGIVHLIAPTLRLVAGDSPDAAP